jgi:HK97 family phage prohead protease
MHLILPFVTQRAGAAPMTFSGNAAVYGRPDDGRDYTIALGAFDSAVAAFGQGRAPAMLLEHGGWGMDAEDCLPIGIWTEMAADGTGLAVTGKLADTQRGRDCYALLSMDPRPAIDGLSLGFRPTQRQVNDNAAPGEPRVTITDMEILEISLVTFPAMTAARVSSVQSGMTERDLERRLTRDAGLSRREARALMRQGWPAFEALRDAGEGEAASKPGALVPSEALSALHAELLSLNAKLKG